MVSLYVSSSPSTIGLRFVFEVIAWLVLVLVEQLELGFGLVELERWLAWRLARVHDSERCFL